MQQHGVSPLWEGRKMKRWLLLQTFFWQIEAQVSRCERGVNQNFYYIAHLTFWWKSIDSLLKESKLWVGLATRYEKTLILKDLEFYKNVFKLWVGASMGSNVCGLVCQSVCQYVYVCVDWSVSWSIGRSVCWSVCRSVGLSVCLSVCLCVEKNEI